MSAQNSIFRLHFGEIFTEVTKPFFQRFRLFHSRRNSTKQPIFPIIPFSNENFGEVQNVQRSGNSRKPKPVDFKNPKISKEG